MSGGHRRVASAVAQRPASRLLVGRSDQRPSGRLIRLQQRTPPKRSPLICPPWPLTMRAQLWTSTRLVPASCLRIRWSLEPKWTTCYGCTRIALSRSRPSMALWRWCATRHKPEPALRGYCKWMKKDAGDSILSACSVRFALTRAINGGLLIAGRSNRTTSHSKTEGGRALGAAVLMRPAGLDAPERDAEAQGQYRFARGLRFSATATEKAAIP